MSMTEEQARVILEPYFARIAQAVSEGYARYRKYPGRPIHRKTTRANAVNDEIIAKAVEVFDGDSTVNKVDYVRKNLRFIAIGDSLLLWFKKPDGLRRCSSYPTEHAKSMYAEGQVSMFPDRTLLAVGYLLNPEETRVVSVTIAPPSRIQAPEWSIEIEIGESVVQMPHPSVGATNTSRVRVKSTVQRKLSDA